MAINVPVVIAELFAYYRTAAPELARAYLKQSAELDEVRNVAATLEATVSIVVAIARTGWNNRDAGITRALDQADKNLKIASATLAKVRDAGREQK